MYRSKEFNLQIWASWFLKIYGWVKRGMAGLRRRDREENQREMIGARAMQLRFWTQE